MTQTAYVFAKTFVADLDAMGRFYASVFGLVENNRHTDTMFGRPISEITYKASAGRDMGGLTLISYLDGNPPAAARRCRALSRRTLQRSASGRWRQAGACPSLSAKFPNSASRSPSCSTPKAISTK
jgi:catechol 2,3-dioxygenase-like lactoylglutathione lyase family enzyme